MEFIQLTAPSAWASYLFYGDKSGLCEGEEHSIDAWAVLEGIGWAVDTEDAGFMKYHDAHNYALAADCQLYTFRKLESDN